jgi:hypothetical protein
LVLFDKHSEYPMICYPMHGEGQQVTKPNKKILLRIRGLTQPTMRALEIPIGNRKSKSSINININCNIKITINCNIIETDACVISDQAFGEDDGNDSIGLDFRYQTQLIF